MDILTQESARTLHAHRTNPEDPYSRLDPDVYSLEEDILPTLQRQAAEGVIPRINVSDDTDEEQKISLAYINDAEIVARTMDMYPESVEEKLAIVDAINGVLKRK